MNSITGIDINSISRNKIWAVAQMVQQNVIKYSLSLRDNIALGNTSISDTQIAVSQSYGRNNNSTLIVYTVASAYKSTDLTSATSTKYNLPPMSEGIFTGSDKNLYILFESGANYYYKGPKAAGASYAKNPMDRAIAVSISKV